MSKREIPSRPHTSQLHELRELGFVNGPTDDSAEAPWSGHGLEFTLPAKMELTRSMALRLVIEHARDDGKREHQKHANAFLELMTGRKHG